MLTELGIQCIFPGSVLDLFLSYLRDSIGQRMWSYCPNFELVYLGFKRMEVFEDPDKYLDEVGLVLLFEVVILW